MRRTGNINVLKRLHNEIKMLTELGKLEAHIIYDSRKNRIFQDNEEPTFYKLKYEIYFNSYVYQLMMCFNLRDQTGDLRIKDDFINLFYRSVPSAESLMIYLPAVTSDGRYPLDINKPLEEKKI